MARVIERTGMRCTVVNPGWTMLRVDVHPKPVVFFAPNIRAAIEKWEIYATWHVHRASLANKEATR